MDSVHPNLPITREQLRDFCAKWQIVEVQLFGSAARGEMTPESDYDLMVEFKPGAKWGLRHLVEMQFELEEFFGRPVDLLEKGVIENPYRRASIERDLTLVYAA